MYGVSDLTEAYIDACIPSIGVKNADCRAKLVKLASNRRRPKSIAALRPTPTLTPYPASDCHDMNIVDRTMTVGEAVYEDEVGVVDHGGEHRINIRVFRGVVKKGFELRRDVIRQAVPLMKSIGDLKPKLMKKLKSFEVPVGDGGGGVGWNLAARKGHREHVMDGRRPDCAEMKHWAYATPRFSGDMMSRMKS